MNINDSLRLTIPNHLSYLDNARHFVIEAARRFGFTDAEFMPIEVGVEEAVTNVMKHAYDVEENSHFDIICEKLPAGMKIIIKERGIPFDPARIAAYKSGQSLDDASTGGLGTFLMQRMMDEVSFHNLGNEGKETHLIKYRKDLSAIEAEHQHQQQAINEPAVLQEKIAYDIRSLEPSEAIHVSKCAFLSHGYTFFDDHIYFPERLIEMNKTGEMVSAVAVTKEGTFMGHAALVYPYPDDVIAELTFVFVNVEYRGQGAFKRLIEYLLTCPKPRPFKAIYAYAVTNHEFTQKANHRFNIFECGLLLATSPSSWKFRGIPEEGAQRISVILYYRYMVEPEAKQLYAPAHHREMIEKLYRNIGANHHNYIAPATPPAPDGETVLETSSNPAENCGEIYVMQYGADAVKAVRKTLRAFCVQQIACVNLFLSLEDPATHTLAAEFEKLGFFFAGVLPYARVGDVLILQYLNNVELDYSKIVVYADIGRDLRDYIEQRDPNAGL